MLGKGKFPSVISTLFYLSFVMKKKSVFRFRHINGSLNFRRWSQLLLGSNGIKFNMMPSRTLPVSDDVIRLRWTRTGLFIVKSTYEQLTKTNYGQSFKNIWKPKSLKKNSMCLLENDAILTKDNKIRESGSLQRE